MGHWSDGISSLPKTAYTREVSLSPFTGQGKGTHMNHEGMTAAYKTRAKISN